MIEETVFTNETLKEIVEKNYNIKVNSISKINRGSANLYSLNNDEYVLKEFQSKYTSEEINKEINIINHLKKDNLLVPVYISTNNNNYSFLYKDKVITLQKFINGYTMENNCASFEQMMESARELGKIAKSLETIDFDLPVNDVSEWYSEKTLNEGIDKIFSFIGKCTSNEKDKIDSDLKAKVEMIKYIKENVNLDDMNNLTQMNTHGDYNNLQFIYEDGHIKAIIDFVSACKMPIVWEIIRSYSYSDPKAKDGAIDIDNLVAYVKEFTKYVKLNKYDLKYMAYLYLIQILTSTFGYKQYIKDNSKTSLLDFAYFRTNLCKHLFDNASLIAESLEKNISVE